MAEYKIRDNEGEKFSLGPDAHCSCQLDEAAKFGSVACVRLALAMADGGQ